MLASTPRPPPHRRRRLPRTPPRPEPSSSTPPPKPSIPPVGRPASCDLLDAVLAKLPRLQPKSESNPHQSPCNSHAEYPFLTLHEELLAHSPKNILFEAAALIGFAYSIGLASIDESAAMQRFGDAYTRYRQNVRPWLPRFRPYVDSAATLYIAETCTGRLQRRPRHPDRTPSSTPPASTTNSSPPKTTLHANSPASPTKPPDEATARRPRIRDSSNTPTPARHLLDLTIRLPPHSPPHPTPRRRLRRVLLRPSRPPLPLTINTTSAPRSLLPPHWSAHAHPHPTLRRSWCGDTRRSAAASSTTSPSPTNTSDIDRDPDALENGALAPNQRRSEKSPSSTSPHPNPHRPLRRRFHPSPLAHCVPPHLTPA